MRILFTLLISSFLFMSCKTTAEQAPSESEQTEDARAQIVDGIVGTVKYIDLEGGFYGIESDAGDSYLPINLADEYKADGLRIMFKMKERTDVMSTKMWGKMVQITEITKI